MSSERAWLILASGAESERAVPVAERLFVGRECAGIEENKRLILDHPSISRDHFELRTDSSGITRLIDSSSNGTRVNGRRVERSEPIELRDGDQIEVGMIELVFRAASLNARARAAGMTMLTLGLSQMVVVVGDVVGYTAMTERRGPRPAARAIDGLFTPLRALLRQRGGTVGNYVGDALFAAWDIDRDPSAPASAVRFAIEADQLVAAHIPEPDILDDDQPVRMGWAVTLGEVATGARALGRSVLHGDAVNLAFRLSSLAGRGLHPTVLVAEEVVEAAPEAAHYEAVGEVWVKGRGAPAHVRAARPIP